MGKSYGVGDSSFQSPVHTTGSHLYCYQHTRPNLTIRALYSIYIIPLGQDDIGENLLSSLPENSCGLALANLLFIRGTFFPAAFYRLPMLLSPLLFRFSLIIILQVAYQFLFENARRYF